MLMNKNKKELIFGALLILTAALVGLTWQNIPETPIYGIILFVYAIIFGCFLLFAKQNATFYVVPVISIAVIAAILSGNPIMFAALAVSIIAVLSACKKAKNAKESYYKIHIRKIIGPSLGMFFTALAIIFSAVYYEVAQKSPDPASMILPRQVFEITLRVLRTPFNSIMPGVKPDSTVDEALVSALRAQLQKSPEVKMSEISIEELRSQVKQNRAEILREIEKKLGININAERASGNEKIADFLYEISIAKISERIWPYITYVPAFLAISYFFALKAVSVVLYYGSVFGIYIIIKLTLMFGFAKKETLSAEKEVLI